MGGLARLVTWTASMAVVLTASTGAGRITITHISVDRSEMSRGETFALSVQAEGEGVDVLNFRIRTPYRVDSGGTPTGFSRAAASGYAVFAGDPSGHILDGGVADGDPAPRSIRVELSTEGLREGLHYLAVFAHNRPGSESHIKDYRNLELKVGDETVSVRVLPREESFSAGSVEFTLPPTVLRPGEPLVCGARLRAGVTGQFRVRLHPPCTWSPAEALPGFTYYPRTHMAYVEDDTDHAICDNGPCDRDPTPGRIGIEVQTADWPAGVHFLTLAVSELDIRGPYSEGQGWYRDFAVKIPAARDGLAIEVHPSVYVGPGTHFSGLVHTGDGRVVTDGYSSDDSGLTWARLERQIPRPNLLRDGTVAGTSYKAYPVEGKPGEYSGSLFLSADGGRTVAGPLGTRVLVPKARAAWGHSKHVGPLFGRSLVELDSGDWLAPMYGWFEGDTEPDRYRTGGTMRRSYICRSPDRGRTWTYLSTVAYRPFLGNEGYSELVIRRLPAGDILALVRTGGNSTPSWQDNPLVMSRSSDGGRTWSPVRRTGVEGVWPDLLVLADGTLVCSTGRPGAFIMFSTDNGETWTDHTVIDAERSSGYTAVCELSPGELLVGYGVRNGLELETGPRRHALRVARVSVRRNVE